MNIDETESYLAGYLDGLCLAQLLLAHPRMKPDEYLKRLDKANNRAAAQRLRGTLEHTIKQAEKRD